MSAPELSVHSRPRYWWPRTAAAIGFALACAFALRGGGGATTAFAAVGGVLFAALAGFGLRQGLRRGPRLTLAADGIAAADLGLGTIPWSALVDVQAFGSAEAPFLALQVAEPAPWLARMPAWPRFVARLLAAQGLPYFSVQLIGVDRDVGEIERAAQRHLPRSPAGRRSG